MREYVLILPKKNPRSHSPDDVLLILKDKPAFQKGRLNRSRGEGRGVSYRKESKKWRARYMYKYQPILVGEFDTKEEAEQALKLSRAHHALSNPKSSE